MGASRAPFRVYAEEEYFAQSGQIAEAARDRPGLPVEGFVFSADVAVAEGAHGSRIAAGTLLVAGAGALGVVLALGAFATSTHVRRKTVLRAVRANGRTAGAALAITATRARHLRPKTISGRARRGRPATAVARYALPVRGSATARSRPNARSSNAAVNGPAAGRGPGIGEAKVGAPAPSSGRESSEGSYGPRAEIAASSDTPARPGAGEFGFER